MTRTRLATKWWILLAVGAGTFMSALDISVVNTILPVISKVLGADVATVEWVVIIYLLLVSGLLPIFGRLGDMYGHKPVYLTGFAIFIISSVLCGLSPAIHYLIIFRGLQALGAAMLSANSPAILTKNFPAEQRGQALGLQATMTYLGLTVGPSLGGWLAGLISWRAVFFINIPVGLAALALSIIVIPNDQRSQNSEKFDWGGALLFMSSLIALLLALNQAHNWGWTSLQTLGLIFSGLILFGLFVYLEGYVSNPMIDLRLFKQRVFTLSVTSAVINYICVYAVVFLMPFYLIAEREFSPAQAGLILTAQPIVMAIIAPLSGTVSDRIGTRIPTVLGMSILAAGLVLLSRLNAISPVSEIMLALSVCGFGIGIFISPNTSALLGSAPRARQGIAAGIMATSRNVGMVLGVGLAGAVFNTVIARQVQPSADVGYLAITYSFIAAAIIAVIGILSALSTYKE